MYERTYGKKYDTLGGYQSAADIAKLMRADIKKEINAGNLPGTARNYTVRVHNYAGGRSIDIRTKNLPESLWQECDGTIPGSEDGYSARICRDYWCKGRNDSPHAYTHQTLTVEGQRIEKILKAIHAAYNYDGSEIMTDYFDVNYYGNAQVGADW